MDRGTSVPRCHAPTASSLFTAGGHGGNDSSEAITELVPVPCRNESTVDVEYNGFKLQ